MSGDTTAAISSRFSAARLRRGRLRARAQRPMAGIGFLGGETPDVFAACVQAFRQGLGS
jgi:hypothetical protein